MSKFQVGPHRYRKLCCWFFYCCIYSMSHFYQEKLLSFLRFSVIFKKKKNVLKNVVILLWVWLNVTLSCSSLFTFVIILMYQKYLYAKYLSRYSLQHKVVYFHMWLSVMTWSFEREQKTSGVWRHSVMCCEYAWVRTVLYWMNEAC